MPLEPGRPRSFRLEPGGTRYHPGRRKSSPCPPEQEQETGSVSRSEGNRSGARRRSGRRNFFVVPAKRGNSPRGPRGGKGEVESWNRRGETRRARQCPIPCPRDSGG